MKILSSYDEAYKIGKEYTARDIEITLKYIFEKHYSCYMLCVKDRDPQLYKLESKSGNTVIDKQINKTLKRKKVKTTTKTWRVMGCIVKPFKKESSFAKEWLPFLDQIKDKLPDGVFILSLSDSVLLPKSTSGDFLPIFAYSGKQGYKDIPIPTYDDLFDKEIGDVETKWSKKKDVAVFRGSSTGCGYTTDTNQRLKLAEMVSDDLDVGITKYTSHLKYNSPSDIGQVKKTNPTVPSLTWKEQSEYKYILHVDGNVVAYRLLKSMLTKSVILRVKSDFIHWADNLLKDGEHYISVKSDLSNLHEVIEWCKNNDAECKKIAESGYKLAKKLLTDDCLRDEFVAILKSSIAYRTQDK